MDQVPAISTLGLTRRFGPRVAVDGVSLEVSQGAVYAFLGPNGAGKTTTIRLLLGLLRQSSGSIEIFGQPMPAQRAKIARSVGAMVESPALYDHLTGAENLDVTRRVLGAKSSETDRVLEIVDLTNDAGRRVGGYSLGMRQRLGIARALLGKPQLLMLDEPTNGLDPAGIRDMRRLIRALPEAQGATVFVSSHLLTEVEQIATHVGLMHQGKLLAQSSLSEFLGMTGAKLEIGVRDAQAARVALQQLGGVKVLDSERLIFEGHEAGLDAAAINARLVNAGFSVFEIVARSPTLEDVFMTLTAEAA